MGNNEYTIDDLEVCMKTVLITGANGGLGTCLVKKYCSEGYQVFAFDYKLDENSARMERELDHLVLFSYIDVRDSASIEKALNLVAANTDKNRYFDQRRCHFACEQCKCIGEVQR